MIKNCPGCGYKIQSKSSAQLGYVPPLKKDSAKYCERCFKIIHYNDALIVTNPTVTMNIIDLVNSRAKFVFFMIDYLNINNETINVYRKIKTNKCLIISKYDIIPRSIKGQKIIEWIACEYQIDEDIVLVSTYKNYNISRIESIMNKFLVDEAYVLGFTNAGKSSLINKIYEANCKESSMITTSVIPNTTMDFINLKINSDMTLIDSPGFTLENNFYDNDDIDLIKKVNARDFLKPITYQLKKDMSIILENKFRFKYLSDNKNSFTFYMSDKIEILKIYDNNVRLKENEAELFKIKADSDLVIKGVGFINIKVNCEIMIYSNYLYLIEVRKSAF